MVAYGNLTQIPLNSVYAGVASLCRLCLCLFLGELNGMEVYATDFGSAYLKSINNKKVCIMGGPKFGPLASQLLIIYNALHGIWSSGKEFGDLHVVCLKEDIGFTPSFTAEPQIFIRKSPHCDANELIGTHVDDLAIVMGDPEQALRQHNLPHTISNERDLAP